MIRVSTFAGLALVSAALAAPAEAQESFPQYMGQLPAQMPVLPPAPLPVTGGGDFVIYPVRGLTYMISGPAGNVLVQAGVDGVLVVDSGGAEYAAGLREQIRRISSRPVVYILNTNADADHVGGNATLGSGEDDVSGGNERPANVQGFGSSPVVAHEQVMFRMLEREVSEGLPTLTYFVEQKDLHFNAEPVSMLHAPGHTGGDSIVFFRRSDVIAAGDIYTPDRYPEIDLAGGGSINAYLVSLNRLIDLTVPEFNQEGGTLVVPGHGRLSDEGDVADYRDMVTFIRDRVQALIDRGMTLAEVKNARPSQDYDVLYGRAAGDRFVEQVYTSLSQASAAEDAAGLEVPQ